MTKGTIGCSKQQIMRKLTLGHSDKNSHIITEDSDESYLSNKSKSKDSLGYNLLHK